MPEIRHYVVRQTREVRVSANSAVTATRIAEAAFKHGQNSDDALEEYAPAGIWGNTDSKIREVSLFIEEE